jgi:signal transduction histidine kinase
MPKVLKNELRAKHTRKKRTVSKTRFLKILPLQEILDSVSAHIAVIDETGVIGMVNKAWIDFAKSNSNSKVKLPERTEIGTNYLHVLRSSRGHKSDEAAPAYTGIVKVLSGKLKIYSLDYRCDSKNERRWFKMIVLPMDNRKGVVITHHDITHAKLLQERHQQYATELQQQVDERTKELRIALSNEQELAKLKTSFITNTSHEFRTPLTAISLATGFIKKYKNEITIPVLNKKMDIIQKQIERMSFLLDDLLALSKQEGQVKINLKRHPLKSLFRGMVEPFQPLQLRFDCSAKWICSDEELLKTIITNLLTNARKYSSPSASIECTVSCNQSHFFISIQDFGIGIPATDKAYIFQSFYRGSNINHVQGIGLGLSIVKSSVESLGGELTVTSQVGKGTTFRFSLPRRTC